MSKNRNSAFSAEKVYEILRKIPKGKVMTYGGVARAMGNGRWARSVGNALHANPDVDKNPCYKIVTADGRLSYSYAFGGIEAQKRRLEADGVAVCGYKVDLKEYGYRP